MCNENVCLYCMTVLDNETSSPVGFMCHACYSEIHDHDLDVSDYGYRCVRCDATISDNIFELNDGVCNSCREELDDDYYCGSCGDPMSYCLFTVNDEMCLTCNPVTTN